MPPRRRDKRKTTQAYEWGDTPEIQALGAGLARQAHFARGYGEARLFGNELAMRATAVPADEKAQIAFLAGRYGDYGETVGPFLQPVTGVNLQKELGLSRHYLDKEFKKNITKIANGIEHSSIHGLGVLRAYKIPQPPPPAAAVRAAKAPFTRSATAAAALLAHQTSSATHRDRMDQRARESFARMSSSPTYLVKTAAKFTEADRVAYMSKLVE